FSCTPPPWRSSLSLHDALPTAELWLGSHHSRPSQSHSLQKPSPVVVPGAPPMALLCPCEMSALSPQSSALITFVRIELRAGGKRSEEHTSELQSLTNLVCSLLL